MRRRFLRQLEPKKVVIIKGRSVGKSTELGARYLTGWPFIDDMVSRGISPGELLMSPSFSRHRSGFDFGNFDFAAIENRLMGRVWPPLCFKENK